jgi:hypothetical protein
MDGIWWLIKKKYLTNIMMIYVIIKITKQTV